MTAVLYRIARFCVAHRVAVLAVWIAGAAALVVVSHQLGDRTSDDLSLPGTDSQQATDALERSFPVQANGTSPIVLHAPSGGKLTDSKYATAVQQAADAVGKAPHVASVVSPLTQQGAAALSKDQSTGYLTVGLDANPGDLSVEDAEVIIDAAKGPAEAAGLDVQTCGQLGQKVSQPATESSELVGIIAAMAILAFTFGTITAMLVPILTAIVALATTLAIVRMLGHVLTVPSIAPTLATMIGLGVGIDYALFIVTRHFRGLGDGLPMHESVARATATSGGAVFFAGCTVTIALVSLAIAQIPLVTTMGLMAAVAVVVAVLAALTLLPACLAALGNGINALRVRRPKPESAAHEGMWARYARAISHRPLLAGLAALAILIPLTIPLFSLSLGQKDVAALSESTTARQAYDLLDQAFGPGTNGPLLIAVTLGSPAEPAAGGQSQSQGGQPQGDARTTDPRLTKLQQDVKNANGVAAVSPIQIDKAGTTAFFNAISDEGPAEDGTTALVNRLRDTTIPGAEQGTDMRAHIGGSTAAYDDLATKISGKLPLQILTVIALSFILLVLAFRTVVIPPQAAVMNVLSIAAAYGVLTAIFQWGWLSGLVGLDDAVPIVSYVPLFMFAILFGLSMDYEVFLVSQIEEHVHAGEDNRGSVVGGLVTSARVITAAAAIMVFVFGSFLLNGDPTVKQFGVGLAVAVILDATVVRCLLVPALMILVGDHNWYMPRWLDRLVPHVSIEGAEFFAARDEPAAEAREPASLV